MSANTPLQATTERNWYASKHRELSKIVGRTQKGRLRWLVQNFAVQVNINAITTGPSEIAAFLVNQGGAGSKLSAMPRISSRNLIYLARTIRNGVDLLIEGRPWKVEISEPVARILRQRSPVRGVDYDEPFGTRSVWQAGSKNRQLTAFLLTSCDLIERHGSWLHRCPREDCRRVFVQDDRRQMYCCSRCSQTRRTRRFRSRSGR